MSVSRVFDTERSLQIIAHVSKHIAGSHYSEVHEEYFFDFTSVSRTPEV